MIQETPAVSLMIHRRWERRHPLARGEPI